MTRKEFVLQFVQAMFATREASVLIAEGQTDRILTVLINMAVEIYNRVERTVDNRSIG